METKKNLNKKIRFALLGLALIVMPLFSGCGSSTQSAYLVNLEVWGIFDDSSDYSEIINQYKNINPYVGDIKYRKFSQSTYRQELIDALASGQGPDIFLINNAWLPSFENKLAPSPGPLMSEQDIRNNFPDVVVSDFMDGGKAYAVPLSVDSMQLYYNRDMFNAAGITAPPKTWQEFNDDIKKLTVINDAGNILQSGAAIGTGKNINRSSDLLSTLMLQDGATMPKSKGEMAKFDEGSIAPNGSVVMAGEQALGYYTQFAKINAGNTINPLYTWNTRMHNSIDAFSEGTAAMMFNYSWQIPVIKNKNPKLNFAVAPIPQISSTSPVTMANYWGYAVSLNKVLSAKQSAEAGSVPVSNDIRTHEAWQFLRFLTLKNAGSITLYNAVTKNSKVFPVNFDPAKEYLKLTEQPAARRDLIEQQKNDLNLGVFAVGNLVAKHWYQADPDSVDNIFAEAIESVVVGSTSLHDALTLAKNRVNFLSGQSTVR